LNHIDQLIKKGIRIPNPASVDVGEEIDIDRICAANVTIFSGCKIFGRNTFISQGAQIGAEGPATLENCYVGPNVALKSGFFQDAAFLKSSSCGSGAHVRKGTILEEEASIAHTVGLKQTILFPFVTLGSLINFCDCLMAGGTSRQNHSEVGSSYIHFNFTPNQDKATPSLIGDVPRGVMLNQSPIFLGGLGGLVGPCRVAYGSVIAAGSICRKDQLTENQLIMESVLRSTRMPYKSGVYPKLTRLLQNNFIYIANLYALRQMYQVIRQQFVGAQFPQAMADGLITVLTMGINERVKQLGRLKDKLLNAGHELDYSGNLFCDRWETIRHVLQDLLSYQGAPKIMDQFCQSVDQQIQTRGKHYIPCIKALTAKQTEVGTQWLQGIVDRVTNEISNQLETED
jgi:UDP-N-acetylglucosamine/UDP-N-acetylgalactosamine diphosphorylase